MSLPIQLTVLSLMFLILASLILALFYFIRDRASTQRMAISLSTRIIFSLLLFLGLWLMAFFGWVQPHFL